MAPAGAAGYPDKAVRIVVLFAAGGVADTTVRIIAEKLGARLGQRFYVENQAGAGGIAAARTVIAWPPDGYTLALLSNGTAISVSLFNKLPFDPLKEFEPISSLGYFDFIFSTGGDLKFKTIGDFIAAAKAKPGALNVGTINIGSTQNLSAELLKTAAGIDFVIIPYRGTPEVQVSLLQGNIALMIDSYASIKGSTSPDGKIPRAGVIQVRCARKARRIFPARGKAASPTTTSFPGMRCLLVPALRLDIVQTLNGALREILADAEVKQRLLGLWHRGQGQHAGGNCRAAEIRHREVAQGDREGWNPTAVRSALPWQRTRPRSAGRWF